MRAPLTDEQLFERFREGGDPAALGDLFDRTAPALLRVAMHLAADVASAEDMLQATFLLAIEERDRWDARRPLLPWLCGILNNRARSERKRRRTLLDPNRLPRPVDEDPQQQVLRVEFDAAVDHAIHALPDVYRPVLRLHLAYGHAPAEIAHALDRAPATVRSQLARGLDLLRRNLPPSLVGGFAVALTSTHGLAAIRHTVLVAGTAAVPATLATAAWIGGITAMKKTAVTLVVAVLATGLWWIWRDAVPTAGRPDAAPAPAFASGRPTADAPAAPATAPTATAAQEPSTRTPIADATATAGALRVRCRYAEDGSAAYGVAVTLIPDEGAGVLEAQRVRTDDRGVATWPSVRAGRATVEAAPGGTCRITVVAGRDNDGELDIPPGLLVRGRVVDEADRPLAGATVWLSEAKFAFSVGQDVASADADGRFRLRAVEPERFISARSPGRRCASTLRLEGAPGTTIDVRLVLSEPGAEVRGRVVDERGEPIAGASVQIGARQAELAWTPNAPWDQHPVVLARSDRAGRFVADGLAPGAVPLWARAPGYRVTHLPGVATSVDPGAEVRVELRRGAVVRGQIHDERGQPQAHAVVQAAPARLVTAVDGIHDRSGPDWALDVAASAADGSYELRAVPPGPTVLQARSEDGQLARSEVVLADDDATTWDVTFTGLSLVGRVVDERGQPLAGCDITGYPPRGQGEMLDATTDADGSFQCTRALDVPYLLHVHVAGGGPRLRPAAIRRGVRPSAGPITLTVDRTGVPSAFVRGKVLGCEGRPPAEAQVLCFAGPFAQTRVDVEPTAGTFRIGPLPPGRIRLQARIGKQHFAVGDEIELVAGQDLDVGVLQQAVPGSVVVEACDTEGRPLAGEAAVVEDRGWGESAWHADAMSNGTLEIAGLAPGIVRVRVTAEQRPATYATVTVRSGEASRVRVEVPAGVPVTLRVAAVSEPVPLHVVQTWRRDGARLHRFDNFVEGSRAFDWHEVLAPGAYEVEVVSETGRRVVNTFVIAATDPPDRVVPLAMP